MPKFFILFLLTCLTLPGAVFAEDAPKLTLPDAADIRIIVDISGSMKKNDPGNLRQPAVRLLARMLPEGTEAGVWTFGQYVNMLVPHGDVTDAWRKMAIDRSVQINSVALRTNLGKAIEVASDDYITGDDLHNTHYILLTDGKVDISDSSARNQKEETRILENVLPELTSRGARFHPVALSSEADAGFLKQLASDSGGRFQVAEDAGALSRAFLEALNTAIPQQQIPIEGNAFTVDGGVKEFTALIFRDGSAAATNEGLELVRPDGTVVSLSNSPANFRWVRETGYDLITVDEPTAGQWRVKGTLGEGSRVTVVSDLKMVVSPVPASFAKDEPVELSVAFFEAGDKITNPDFLQVLNVSLVITADDGRSGTKVLSGNQPPEDGVYTDTINGLPGAGEYTVEVIADGKTFARKFSAVTEFVVPESAAGAPTDETFGLADETQQPATEPVGEPEPEPAPKVDAEPVIDNPIDVAQVEQPETEEPAAEKPAEATHPASQESSGVPLWVILAVSGVGLVIVGLVVWLLLRRRKSEEAVVPDSSDTIPELTEEAEPDEEEPAPELTDEVDGDSVDETIPVADAVVEADELPDDDESIPELDELAELPEEESSPELKDKNSPELTEENSPELTEEDAPAAEKDDEPAVKKEEDDDEFGLEDFDLSEFDDLPDGVLSEDDPSDDDLPDDSDKPKK
jgi:hypothetical protein